MAGFYFLPGSTTWESLRKQTGPGTHSGCSTHEPQIELSAAAQQRVEMAVLGLLGLNCVNNAGSGKGEKASKGSSSLQEITGRLFAVITVRQSDAEHFTPGTRQPEITRRNDINTWTRQCVRNTAIRAFQQRLPDMQVASSKYSICHLVRPRPFST